MNVKSLNEKILNNRKLLFILLIINITGFFYGIYYYQFQLMETPVYLWIFTLDSPLPVLLFAIIIGLKLTGKKIPDILVLFTIVGMIKYGLWTDIVLIMHWNYFFSFSPLITSLNIPLHFGMILEGILIFHLLKKSILRNTVLVLAFFIINDFLDYFFGIVTRVPDTYLNILVYEAFLSSVLITGIVYLKKK